MADQGGTADLPLRLVPGTEVEGRKQVGKKPLESWQQLKDPLVCSPGLSWASLQLRLSWAASIGCPLPTSL